MSYLKIIRQVFNENIPIFIKYWWFFLSISLLYHGYQYLILTFISVKSEYFSVILAVYHVLITPIIMLVIMYVVDCYNKNKLPTDFNKLIKDTRRCYIRIFLIYLTIYFVRKYFGFGATLIIFVIMYIKFPFLEQEIFFRDTSLWKAIKNNNELTNQESTIKTITVLIVLFLIVYGVITKISQVIISYEIQHEKIILYGLNILMIAFFLFCKAVLTKVYTYTNHT
ncbi:MAG: hypothetical protein HRU36_06080 [Rickettsiales bacterium]|nr:hypothetical protein [Rickettsiales bacterium]